MSTIAGNQGMTPEGLHGVNQCISCEQRFSCLNAFDKHIRGDGDECLPPQAIGLAYTNSKRHGWVWSWPVAANKRNDDAFYAKDRADARSTQ